LKGNDIINMKQEIKQMNIMQTTVKIKKLNAAATVPSYGTEFAAGADLYACMEGSITINPGQTEFIHTGLAMEIPTGLVGLIYARSGMACKKGVAPANKVGVIDSDYRGEIIVALHNHSDEPLTVSNGERIAQIVYAPYYQAEFVEADELEESLRGEGGFGSTGTR
jgi:dUTP pyrophosphatase